jgi:tRNA1Val (adenine37-N6)-methyltransferase
MSESSQKYFSFKEFKVHQEQCAMKVGTDGVLLGSWVECNNSVSNVLDIGTGTGLLALMLAQKCNALIDAIDIDSNACNQAKENFCNSKWSDRLSVIHRPIQEFAAISNMKYDLIVSNPPFFINAKKSQQLNRNVARHLDDSFTMDDLITSVAKLLSDSGKFFLIQPVKEGSIFMEESEKRGLYVNNITWVRTKEDKEEKRLLLNLSRNKKKIITDYLSIQTKEGKYTDEYIKLTEEYYTHLPERSF